MKNKILYIILASTCILSAKAQQEAHFTQFADNQLFVNPAYAGSNEILNATVLHRQQWVGFTGAPQTSTFSMHSPLSYESVGLGVTMVSDQIGPLSQNMIYGDFSYTLRFSNQTKLAFGLKAGMNVINVNSSGLNTSTENDPNLMKDVRNQVNPNLGFGVYYHSKNWFFGASTPKIFESSYDGTSLNIEKRHFFVNAGTVFKASPSLKFRPMIQAKFTEGAPLSLDAAMTAIVQEKVFIGAMYRLNSAGGLFVQYQLAPTFRIGLGTEIGLTEIRKYNDGTFELMLSYDLANSKSGIKSPRYF
jgi:type IX secretion system PorP/SprF family membrane protein